MSARSGRAKLAMQFAASALIAAFFLWLSVTRMSGDMRLSQSGEDARQSVIENADSGIAAVVDGLTTLAATTERPSLIGEVWDSIRQVDPWLVVAYFGLFLVVHVARLLRWVVQVRPLGERDWKKVFRICAVGFAAIIIFPLRVGELVRPWLLARESEHVSFSEALGTAIVERVIDGLLMTLVLFFAIVTAPGVASPLLRNAGWVSLGVFGGAAFGLILFTVRRSVAIRLIDIVFGTISVGLADRLKTLLEGFVGGVGSLTRSGALGPYLFFTAMYWGLNGFGLWLWAGAFGIELPLIAGYGLLGVLVVGLMIPAGPGFFGNFQLFLGEGLRLYSTAPGASAAGFAFSLTLNLMQFGVQVLFAFPFAVASGLSLGGLADVQSESQAAGENEVLHPRS